MQSSGTEHILFVVGMHRSGTSAACAALHACGATFGEKLLSAMENVNAEGFWESSGGVDINEELLGLFGVDWYSVSPATLGADWSGGQFARFRTRIADILQCELGEGPVAAIKDPRLCLTLPLWLSVCREIGLPASVCFVKRNPMAAAASLQQRDAFPIGYGLRLTALYWRSLAAVEVDVLHTISYEALLQSPALALAPLVEVLPLQLDSSALDSAVQPSLRSQVNSDKRFDLSNATCLTESVRQLEALIDAEYPTAVTLSEMAAAITARGLSLQQIGMEHSKALSTLDQRDEDVAYLDKELQRVGAELGDLHARHRELHESFSEAMDGIMNQNRLLQPARAAWSRYRQWRKEKLAETRTP